eukprot:7565829-Ditylum_brightwellii.AAC.1
MVWALGFCKLQMSKSLSLGSTCILFGISNVPKMSHLSTLTALVKVDHTRHTRPLVARGKRSYPK